MSLRNHRAAATAVVGVLAGMPVGAASAASNSVVDNTGAPPYGTRDNPIDPAPGHLGHQPDPSATGGWGSAPQGSATTPATTPTPPATPATTYKPPTTPATYTPPTYTPPTTPVTTPTLPTTGDLSTAAQCGQVNFTNTLPAVITCGPVTITFNTVTVTTTTTTVSAPITAANGSINTSAVSAPTPATRTTPVTIRQRRRQPTRVKRLKSAHVKNAIGTRKGGAVLNAAKPTRALKLRLLRGRFAAHASR